MRIFVAYAFCVVVYFCSLVHAREVSAQSLKTKPSERWIVFASREDIAEAAELARKYAASRPDIRVFKSSNGWFAVAAGPVATKNAQSIVAGLVSSGNVPPDTILSEGSRFVEDVTSLAKSQTIAVSSQADIDQAVALLSAAYANPLPPILKKEVDGGRMLFFNSTVHKQQFTGDGRQFRSSFSEEITQEASTEMGGSFRISSLRREEVAFKDLQHAWIHGDELDSSNRRVTLKCSAGRECVSWSEDGKSGKDAEARLVFKDNQTAKDALLAIEILMRASR